MGLKAVSLFLREKVLFEYAWCKAVEANNNSVHLVVSPIADDPPTVLTVVVTVVVNASSSSPEVDVPSLLAEALHKLFEPAIVEAVKERVRRTKEPQDAA